MELALLLLPLVGGYCFASYSLLTSYSVAREEGNKLYFRAALYGTALFLAVAVLRDYLLDEWYWYENFEAEVRAAVEPLASTSFALAITSVYSVILGFALPHLTNPFLPKAFKRYWIRRAIRLSDFERIVQRAWEKHLPLRVTLESSKVYVGFVVTTVDPRAERRSIGLLPILSGYRDETQKVTFTTDYRNVYQQLRTIPAISVSNFEIALPVEKIESCNIFDFRAYRLFLQQASVDPATIDTADISPTVLGADT